MADRHDDDASVSGQQRAPTTTKKYVDYYTSFFVNFWTYESDPIQKINLGRFGLTQISPNMKPVPLYQDQSILYFWLNWLYRNCIEIFKVA